MQLHRPVDGKQDVFNSGGVQIRRSGYAATIEQREAVCEGLDGASGAIVTGTAQLNKIVRRRDGNEQASMVAEDTPEFGWVHPGRDGHYDGERTVRVGHEPIGVG